MDISAHAVRAESLKAGDVDIVLQTTERGLIDSIRIMNENKELRNARTADLALKVAKQFYYCTRTEIPSEIQSILDSVPPVEESDCRLPD